MNEAFDQGICKQLQSFCAVNEERVLMIFRENLILLSRHLNLRGAIV